MHTEQAIIVISGTIALKHCGYLQLLPHICLNETYYLIINKIEAAA